MQKDIAVFGDSAFSREVADVCYAAGYDRVVFLAATGGERRDEVSGIEVYSESKALEFCELGFDFIIGIGEPNIRSKIVSNFETLPYVNVIHPSATFGTGQLEKLKASVGNVITAGARFTNNIEVGNHNVFNLNVTIGHDCIIEDFVTLSPGANISGNVALSCGAYIGTGATILQGQGILSKLRVGDYSIVGAGAVVSKHVGSHSTVVGIPAKPLVKK